MGDPVPYASRRRVGMLVIPDEIVAPEEIRTLLGDPTVQFCQHRVDFAEVDTPANRAVALSAMDTAMHIIARVRPDAVVFACTSGGVFGGAAFHADMLAAMRSVLPGVEVATAADAVARALTELNAHRIVIGTPYGDDTVAALVEMLTERGIEVLSTTQLFAGGYPGPWTVMSTDPAAVRDFACAIDDPDADAVFVSCAGLPSASMVAAVETAIGKPFLTSNTALAWVLQRALGSAPATGFGALLAGERR